MSDDESTSQHKAVRHKSGEYDPIYEILRSQQKMQAEINQINIRLSSGDHALNTVNDHAEEIKELRDKSIELKTQMKGIMWFAGTCGVAAIGAIVMAFFALILKAHP